MYLRYPKDFRKNKPEVQTSRKNTYNDVREAQLLKDIRKHNHEVLMSRRDNGDDVKENESSLEAQYSLPSENKAGESQRNHPKQHRETGIVTFKRAEPKEEQKLEKGNINDEISINQNLADLKIAIETTSTKHIQEDLEFVVKKILEIEKTLKKLKEDQKELENSLKVESVTFEKKLVDTTTNLEQGIKNTLGKLRNDIYTEINEISQVDKRKSALQRNAHDIETNLSNWQDYSVDVSSKASSKNENRELKNVLSRIQNSLGRLSST